MPCTYFVLEKNANLKHPSAHAIATSKFESLVDILQLNLELNLSHVVGNVSVSVPLPDAVYRAGY